MHSWNTALGGYKLFRRDQQGRKSMCSVKKTELKNSDEWAESLGAKTTKKISELVFTTGCLTKRRMSMERSYFSCGKHHAPRL